MVRLIFDPFTSPGPLSTILNYGLYSCSRTRKHREDLDSYKNKTFLDIALYLRTKKKPFLIGLVSNESLGIYYIVKKEKLKP